MHPPARAAVLPLLVALCGACGEKVEHPAAAPDCDPSSMECTSASPTPPRGGGLGSGSGSGQGGDGSSGPEAGLAHGLVAAYSDDTFEQGAAYTGMAEVSAMGVDGARVKGTYTGDLFELENVLETEENWFLVQPTFGNGMLPTISVVDTTQVASEDLHVGITSDDNVDSIFVTASGSERSAERAQLVLRVVDQKGTTLAGVVGTLVAEVTAYRAAGSWLSGADGTDASGLMFFGNVPAATTLSTTSITLGGAVNARVDARVMAGATTVITAVVELP